MQGQHRPTRSGRTQRDTLSLVVCSAYKSPKAQAVGRRRYFDLNFAGTIREIRKVELRITGEGVWIGRLSHWQQTRVEQDTVIRTGEKDTNEYGMRAVGIEVVDPKHGPKRRCDGDTEQFNALAKCRRLRYHRNLSTPIHGRLRDIKDAQVDCKVRESFGRANI